MNSETKKKKKLSEYQIEDIKNLFSGILKKISSKIILLEIGNDFLNVGLAKSQKNNLYIKKVFWQDLPKDALDKSIPSDPKSFGLFLKQIIDENKINTNRIAVSLPSDACYTRLIEIPEEVKEDESISFLENPDSGIQIPISLGNSDFDINLTNLPKKELKNKIFNRYFLTSLPKKNVDIILQSLKHANLEVCLIQTSHLCIANLLKTEIDKLSENDLIISVDLLDEFTQFVIFDSSGPLVIKRLASIRKYPSIEEIKKINASKTDKSNKSKSQSKSENYHALSKLDLKVLLREINESFNNFLNNNNLNKKGKIFLSGRNSQHKNLVELIGKSLKMDVALISPINTNCLKEFSYNPDEINQFSMSRLIGLGLTLIKDKDFENESKNKEFIIKDFVYKENNKEDLPEENENFENTTVKNLMNSLDELNNENKKLKANSQTKSKSEESKKEIPPLPNLKVKGNTETKSKSEESKKELPPLPNLKIKGNTETKSKSEESKKELPPLPNLKIKGNTETKSKSEESKKELPPLPNLKIKGNTETKSNIEENKKELPPLPNLKIKGNTGTKSNIEENKKELPSLRNSKNDKTKNIDTNSINNQDRKNNEAEKKKIKEKKSFKMDKSFLKDD